jgi:hypothetical protein
MTKITQQVMPTDQWMAQKLEHCMFDSLYMAMSDVKNGNHQRARYWVTEFNRCSNELDELIAKKDEIENMAKRYQELGYGVVIINGEQKG